MKKLTPVDGHQLLVTKLPLGKPTSGELSVSRQLLVSDTPRCNCELVLREPRVPQQESWNKQRAGWFSQRSVKQFIIIIALASYCFAFTDETVIAQEKDEIGKQVAAILARNCSACHNTKKPEGGLVLESYAGMMKGGDSGPAVVANMVDQGELLARVIATDDSAMPPTDNAVGAKRLTEAEVALIKTWVSGGATPFQATAEQVMNWRDITGALKPIYASDVSPDGSYVGFGFGNVAAIVNEPFATAKPTVDYLIDPELKLTDGTPIKATHLDLVQSIAFSPDSQVLVTGGFRTVKFWRRQTKSAPLANPVPAGGRLLATNGDKSRLAYALADHSIAICDSSNQQLTSLRGHGEAVLAATWTTNAPMLFSCDSSGKMLRWNLPETLTPAIEFPRPDASEPVPPVILVTPEAKDLRALASASESNVLFVRADNKLVNLRITPATDATATTTTFTPQAAFDRFESVSSIGVTKLAESVLYVVAFGNAVELISTETAETSKRLEQGEAVGAMTLSSDGTKLAAAGISGQVKLWNLQDGKPLTTLQGDYDHLRAVQTGERDVARKKAFVDFLAARVPELKKEAEKEVEARKKVEEAHSKAAEALAAKKKDVETATGAVTATQASIEETKKVIEEANKRVATLMTELEAKQKAVAEAEKNKTTADEELAKNAQALATATEGVERANAAIPAQEQTVASETAVLATIQQAFESLQKITPVAASALAFDVSGAKIVVAATDNSLNLFDVASGKPVAKLQSSETPVNKLFIVADQQMIGGDGSLLFRWNLNLPWQLERTVGGPAVSPFSDRITALDFSPDGKWLAVGSGPPSRFGDVKLIAVDSGELYKDLGEAHSDTIFGIRFSPDGRQLATCGADKLCRLYEIETGKLLKTFEGHTHHVLGVAWKNDGLTLATASADNSVKTWNVISGERKQSIGGFTKEVTGIDFVGQTDQVITSSIDGQSRLHNASNGQQVRAFSGPNSALYTVSVTNDGKFVTVGGQSGELWIWQVADAKLVRKLPE